MTLTEYAQKVKELREAQKVFFQYRSTSALNLCKRLEKEVDKMTVEILGEKKENQLSLL